ncbi:MAG: ABC transporter permease [Lachnospiraceae bacterium]|nr:ABC transporter permease [Lachnospiraceae bacterium]MCI9151329.1 ABC transporter permease [Lachnospiraceae bacterium]
MKQFRRILSFELKYYFKNKIFVGVTVFLVLLLAGVMFFPRVKEGFASGSSEADTGGALPVMLVRAAELEEEQPGTGRAEQLERVFGEAFAGYEVRATQEDVKTLREKILAGEAACAFDVTGDTSYTYYVENRSMFDTNMEIAGAVLQKLYQMRAMAEGGMAPEQVEQVMTVEITGEAESLGKDQRQNYWYTYIMIFALYMVILLYGQMVATNVATEKSSRTMEVLITSAKPTAMMFGKVIASCLAGLAQLVAVFGCAILFYSMNRDYWGDNFVISSIFDMPPMLLAYMVIFFILGFFIYAFLYGAIGSTASKLEDINTSVMPITILFIIAFFVVMFSLASNQVDHMGMLVCSYVPFTSPMAMFTRIAMSTVPWYEIVISILILIGSVIGIGVLSAKIYRVGVLLYGATPKPGAILKAMRNSR